MKKFMILALSLALCASMTACMMVGDPGDSTIPTINLDAEPEIVLDATKVEQENRYDAEGNHVGYYRYTNGTNCGNPGIVLIEFTDLNGNVLNSYSPKFAGGTLSGGQFGGTTHGQYELTDIWESDYSDAVNSNSYQLVPYSGGQLYAYIENRNGATVRCDLYGTDGQVVASISPADLKNRLDVECLAGEVSGDVFRVIEGYSEDRPEGPTFYMVRQMYYDLSGALLCEISQTYAEDSETNKKTTTRCQVKNASGTVLRTYETSGNGFDLEVSYDARQRILFATESKIEYEPTRVVTKFTEYFDPARNLVLYREDNIYENGEFSRRDYTVFGGKVALAEGPIKGTYGKLEFYDAQGVLKKKVEAPEGQCLYFGWTSGEIRIDFYDVNGNLKGSSYYEPQ